MVLFCRLIFIHSNPKQGRLTLGWPTGLVNRCGCEIHYMWYPVLNPLSMTRISLSRWMSVFSHSSAPHSTQLRYSRITVLDLLLIETRCSSIWLSAICIRNKFHTLAYSCLDKDRNQWTYGIHAEQSQLQNAVLYVEMDTAFDRFERRFMQIIQVLFAVHGTLGDLLPF